MTLIEPVMPCRGDFDLACRQLQQVRPIDRCLLFAEAGQGGADVIVVGGRCGHQGAILGDIRGGGHLGGIKGGGSGDQRSHNLFLLLR